MADRTVRVVLTAATQQFDAAMQRAAGSAKALQSNMEKAQEAGDLKALQGPLIAYGTAMTAVGAAVAKTGIEYNTLQQTSRAALTTLTGSAEAANAQMDKLDDFARTSPFGKDIFIRAQQQMLAFGVETEKVIPYLDALNDATAAAGGNGQQLGELAYIMAQISAAGKITAQDLMQFGQRGVNAAELIGDSMGKTGAQIRQSITDGTLDADQALDALAQGMSEKFEGASANVKNTMAGAFDRVKAAWRDLSAAIMEPAVSQSGGGFLVDATNSVADFLRGVEALPGPVKQAGAALGAISGAAALAAGGFITLVPKMLEAHAAFKTLSSTFPGIGAKAGIAGLAIAGATTVIGLAVSEMGKHAAAVDEYVAILQGAGDDSEKQIRQFHAQRLAAEGVGDELERMGLNARLAVEATMGDLDAREKIIDAYNREAEAKRAAAEASDASGEMAAFEQSQITSLETRRDRILELIEAERALAAESQETAEQQRQMAMTSEEGQRAWGEAVKAYHTEGRGEMAATTASVRELTEAEQEWLDTVVAASSGFIDHFDALKTAQQQYAERAAVNAGESADAWKDFAESGKFSLADFAAALREQVAAMDQWEANIIALTGRVSQETVDMLIEMGKTNPELAAQAAAQMVTATDSELSELEPLMRRHGQQSGQEFNATLESTVGGFDVSDVMAAVMRKGGTAAVEAASLELARGEATLADIVARYNLQAELRVNTDPAERAARAALDRISRMSATVQVRAYHASGFNAPVWTGGRVGDVAAAYGLAGGGYSGYVRGPGTTTSDEAATVNLSRDEFVIRAWAASRIGAANLYHMNRTGQIPPRPQNIIHRTSTATASTVNNNHEAPQITLAPGAIQIHGLNAVHAVEELQRELAGRFEQTGGRHG